MIKEIKFKSYEKSVPELLDSLNFSKLIAKQKKIVLKPNLTLNKPFPITTHADFTEAVLKYCKQNSQADILIAEGSGGSSTQECFEALGYTKLAEKYGVKLINLNQAPVIQIKNPRFKKFKTIEFPQILLDAFVISLPVLKEHGEAIVTIALKNMLGCYPGKYYGGGRSGTWKTHIHQWDIDYSINDILVCKFPDFAIVDASYIVKGGETSGTPEKCGKLLAGSPIETDKLGTELLGHNWKQIKHIIFASELPRKK